MNIAADDAEGQARLAAFVQDLGVGEDVAKFAGRDLKKQESRWACRRSGSSHVSVGLTGLLNPT
jgi:hypothetical protein